MLMTVSTTHTPATDLGFLLVKHPDRVHQFEMPAGLAYVMYPEATEQRCTAALLLDIDPHTLSSARHRAKAPESAGLGQFVNDRPYAASSMLASALGRIFRSALRGASKDRPELAATPIPLEIAVPVLRCRGGAELAPRLFDPLGWATSAAPIPLDDDWGDSRYVELRLTGTLRLADALNHLYVLLPVLDDAKHYWIAPDEIDKLIRAGEGWLAGHPERTLITRRFLAHRRALAGTALARLAEERRRLDELDEVADPDTIETPEVEARQPLAVQRRESLLAVLRELGAARVLDLGCGSGALLSDLVRDRRFTEIVGADVSSRSLEIAERRLRLDRLPERQRDRIKLWQTALTYRDDRLRGFDAAVLMEVIEHVDPPRLAALEDAVFGHAAPISVLVTTPNSEYNVHYELEGLRHHDHRFEWTRAEFTAWSTRVAEFYGYTVRLHGIGEQDPETGTPTQFAVFTREVPA
ncbi:3' terminal RNA ribose 2'-O-methyltransferase Hen1 [Catenuloplanes sp. NPDC051500]|uniref:3' terminal RNA ribose 2'-O-methyltransferase Hen1 n=1 Tax=Catenuloplanes sp. NPDC051500 TaxID=3363959 RepID=UPI0037A1A381